MKVNEDRHITEPEETSPTTSTSRRAPKTAAVDQGKRGGELPGVKHIEENPKLTQVPYLDSMWGKPFKGCQLEKGQRWKSSPFLVKHLLENITGE